MKSSLLDYIKKTDSRRVNLFFSLCFPVCDFVEEHHRKGILLKKLNPGMICLDLHNEKVELTYHSRSIEEFLPYISPEQTGRISRQVDYRSDFYSLGAIFYELLTGEVPLRAEDVLGWSYAHISLEPKPPNELNPEIPSVLSNIIMKLLAKSPDERYQSIVGLKADLERCCREWQAAGKIDPFTLGQADISERLQFQNKLFGRGKETAALMEALNKVCRGSTESVIISGYPGVGKTALVNEFRSQIVCTQVQFIHGSYKQFQRDIPYTAITQAIRDMVRQILAGSREEIKSWENRIRKVLGINGGIITEIIPELKLLTGEFPPVRDMPPRESENRFFQVFKSFLQVFVQEEHPLVVFLDDLQWIDLASLKLIQALTTDTGEGHLLFIGAYRTNEVDKTHPVFSIIQSLEEAHIPVSHIMLEALDINNTQELITNILRCKGKDINVLANGIFSKSAGNPLYVRQIIQNLYEDGYLYFSSEELCWKCKDAGLQNIDFKESVVDFVVNRIKKLPGETIDLLKFASCLGKKFYSDTLSDSLNRPVDWIKQVLQPALNMGIIIEEAGLNLAENFLNYSGNLHEERKFPVCYEFLHDRVREAAYSLMSGEEKKTAHFKAGRAILEKTGSISPGEGIFEAVDHLNQSADLIRDEKERIKLAECNLMAAEKAKLSLALSASLKYLEAGIKLLPENSWEQFYSLSFELYLEYYWCRFSCHGFSAAEPIFQLLMKKAKSGLDKTEVYFRKTILCTGYYKPEDAILSGLAALKHLGLILPIRPGKKYLVKEILSIKLQLMGKKMEALLHYPEMSNDRAKKIMVLLANLTPPTSLTNPELFSYILLKMTSISLRYGNTDYSAFAYACYGIVCSSRFRDFQRTVRLQEVALALAEKYHNYTVKCKVYYTVAVYLNHWSMHLRKSLDYGEKAHYYARETGDWMVAGVTQTEMVQMKCMLGESLNAIYQQYEAALENIRYGMPDSLNLLNTINQFIKNLKGETFGPFTFSSENYDEDTVADRMIRTKKGFIVNHYYLMKIQSYYLHGGCREAFDIALQLCGKLDSILGKMLYAENVYWACLTASAVYDRLDNRKKKEAQKLLKKNLWLLKKWSEACEENFLHKYSLASAEQHRLKGNIQKAMNLYKKAVSLAHKNGYTLDVAVACELTARFYLELGFEKNAQVHMVSAYRTYVEFGAALKAKLLRAEYPELLSEAEQAVIKEEQEKARKNSAAAIEGVEEDAGMMSGISQDVDFLTLSRATDSFSGNPDLENSLRKLLGVIVESSGAQRAYLMTVKDETIVIIARKEKGQEPVIFPEEIISDENRWFSRSVVMYVLNTGESVILNDAVQDAVFNKDPYIRKNGVKSVLCLPIFLQDDLAGILYLENNLTACAFSAERTEILEKLALQAVNASRLAMMLSEKGSRNGKIKQNTAVSFTEKETKILELMAAGLSNLEIAEKIHISEGTVKWHTNHIFKKLEVGSRTQAVIKANELGLLQKNK